MLFPYTPIAYRFTPQLDLHPKRGCTLHPYQPSLRPTFNSELSIYTEVPNNQNHSQHTKITTP